MKASELAGEDVILKHIKGGTGNIKKKKNLEKLLEGET